MSLLKFLWSALIELTMNILVGLFWIVVILAPIVGIVRFIQSNQLVGIVIIVLVIAGVMGYVVRDEMDMPTYQDIEREARRRFRREGSD